MEMTETHLEPIDDVRIGGVPECTIWSRQLLTRNASFVESVILEVMGIKDWSALPKTLEAPVSPLAAQE
jgi:hypothetical protein